MHGCIRRAREGVYFPWITAVIKKVVFSCPVCVRFQTETQNELLMPHSAASGPWEKVGTDKFSFQDQDYLELNSVGQLVSELSSKVE